MKTLYPVLAQTGEQERSGMHAWIDEHREPASRQSEYHRTDTSGELQRHGDSGSLWLEERGVRPPDVKIRLVGDERLHHPFSPTRRSGRELHRALGVAAHLPDGNPLCWVRDRLAERENLVVSYPARSVACRVEHHTDTGAREQFGEPLNRFVNVLTNLPPTGPESADHRCH
uniref:Unannotated protein n=1 Tax=freshwater metagenome TaxID=449393 RepID=A0A6J7MBE6_9ZZZZ